MRVVFFEYLADNINLNNQGTLKAAIKQIVLPSKGKDISLFLSKNDKVAQKIAEEFKHVTNKVKKFEITTDLESNPNFQEIFQKGNTLIVTIFPDDCTFCNFLKEKVDPAKKIECVFGQIGSIKIISLKKSSLTN
ncbi:MAG: hypothetical protein PHP97_03065 [Candidatus Shapirobacteria bacterium]|nr:hypothetical protein [Candidatus Shapirobacteria bacterium]MDD3002616.1 hypothetical protein [Candidatus Shapirobacteria bacterium]